MDARNYKLYHENHMMFNNGTSIEECGILLSIIPFLVFISLWVTTYVSTLFIPVLEFCIIILPVILYVTVFSEIINVIFLIAIFFYIVIFAKNLNKKEAKNIFDKKIGGKEKFVTNFRACTNFVSAICILAVDFNIFPKKFAKTETYGFSLMDLGVGFFICSNGLVEKYNSTKNQITKLLKTTITLFILGMSRLIVTKALSYQEHITEYGTHWNFFFTLALCKIFVFLIKLPLKEVNPFKVFLITGTIHEICLNLGLKKWVLSDLPRNSFVVANREGLSSCLGFVSLYFAASSIQKFIILSKNLTYKQLLFKLILICILFWIGTLFCFKITGISRRLVNLGYILWVISLSLTVVILFLVEDLCIITIKAKENKISLNTVPQIFQSINSNALFFFLFSNLLTGLINCIFQTLLLENFISLIIIIIYMGILCKVTHYLYVNKIFLKF